jgi:hypothetical protein
MDAAWEALGVLHVEVAHRDQPLRVLAPARELARGVRPTAVGVGGRVPEVVEEPQPLRRREGRRREHGFETVVEVGVLVVGERRCVDGEGPGDVVQDVEQLGVELVLVVLERADVER